MAVLLMLMFGGVSLASFLGLVIAQFAFGVPLLSDPTLMDDLTRPELTPVLRMMQVLQAFGMLIGPSLFYLHLAHTSVGKLFRLPMRQPVMLSIALFMVALPLINFLADWNAHIALPGAFGEWAGQKESDVEKLTERFLQMPHVGHLIFNLFMIALLPAVGEELLFRGVLQPGIAKWCRNGHVGVWAAAFLFSAIHMQFLGFVPRLLMGAMLGYVFLWSENLWYPMIAHFANNAMAVLLAFAAQHGLLRTDMDNVGIENPMVAAFSLGFCMMLLYLFKAVHRAAGITSVE